MSGSNLSPPAEKNSSADEPLALTVHSMGMPGDASARTRAGRWKMLAVIAVCAAPVIASYFTYYVLRPEGRRNYGELINPQRPMPAVQGQRLDGQAANLPSIKGNWLLVSVAGGACDNRCEKHLYVQRQLRETLGKEKDRVDWVWLINDAAPVRAELQPALQAATVLRLAPADLAAWLQAAPGQDVSAHLYVVDPQGNWMMRFPAEFEPAKGKRDLDRLLRASAFWHKPLR
jgi:hypothetical protein